MLGEDPVPVREGPAAEPAGAEPATSDRAGYDLEGRRRARAAIERRRATAAATLRSAGIVTEGPARPGTAVLVAVATTGDGMVNQHFGRAREFWIYEAAPGRARFVGIRQVPRSCGGPATCGAPSDRLTDTVRLLGDCAAVLCCKIGPQPHGALTAAGIEPIEVTELIEPAVARTAAELATRQRRLTAAVSEITNVVVVS
jgi:nitrogen fixation protein NifB